MNPTLRHGAEHTARQCDRRSGLLNPTAQRSLTAADEPNGDSAVRQSVKSSMILSVGYDSATNVLEIEFRRGPRVYRYSGVPEFLYQGLMAAPSKGQFFTSRIADLYRTECVQE
jgi:KTSC domain